MKSATAKSFQAIALASLLTAAGLVGSQAHADLLTGDIQNNGTAQAITVIVKDSGKLVKLDAAPSFENVLRRLKSGDSITAQGSMNADQTRFSISSIDRIGLKDLLGTWKSTRWEIFEFQDFSQLNLYIPKVVEAGGVSLARTHSLKYVVTPEENDAFTIFMTDDSDVRMGFLEIGNNKLKLNVIDSHSGNVTESISLSPLYFHD